MQADREEVRPVILKKKQQLAIACRRRVAIAEELQECEEHIHSLMEDLESLEDRLRPTARKRADGFDSPVSIREHSHREAVEAARGPTPPQGRQRAPPGFEGNVAGSPTSSDLQGSPQPWQGPRQVGAGKSPVRQKVASKAPIQLYVPGARRRAQPSSQTAQLASEVSGGAGESEGAPQLNERRDPPAGFPTPQYNSSNVNGAEAGQRDNRAERRAGFQGNSVEPSMEANATTRNESTPSTHRRGSWDALANENSLRAMSEHRGTAPRQQEHHRSGQLPLEASRSDLAATRREINTRMDSLVPHDGTPILKGGRTAEGASTEVPLPRKIREWDQDKPSDPQKEIFDRAFQKGQRTALDWADEPESPVETAASNGGGSFPPRGRSGRFEDDFPGLVTGRESQPQREWMVDDSRRSEEFPTLGQQAASTLSSAWGSGNIKEKLTDGRPFSSAKSHTASDSNGLVTGVEEAERRAGLRHHAETRSDAELRRLVTQRSFEFFERIRGRDVNVVEGLQLHSPVLTEVEQVKLEGIITGWVLDGTQGKLVGRTFSAPRKWTKGKGRITVQFGCCYNYAVDSQGRKPGIVAEEVVEPMPPVLNALVKRLVRWGVLPRSMEPDSAIVNIYEEEDCIPPHIDHHDFSRPFCTVSLLSQEKIMFGSRLVPEGPGVFHGVNDQHTMIDLPVGSCLVLQGNGADVAMHCVPPVQARRMSITLRKMGLNHAGMVRQEAIRQAQLRQAGRSESPQHLPRAQPTLSDYIVTARSRSNASRDARRDGRWEEADLPRSVERW